ncbi:MAG: monofunctional biosynthetic peptidoglycan transglycosylase, partial [bacterium]
MVLAIIFFLVEIASIPWVEVASLKTRNPTETALMRQRSDEAENEGKHLSIKQKWIPLSRLPNFVANAVIVAEDGTFREHSGFDWYEFKQSLQKNWEMKKVARGGSTITQQLAKNLYLSTSKDPIRKLKEAVIALLLERYLDKNRILEIYLNVIEWGPGIFGIEAASETYFGHSARALTFDQALRLAAVIPSPLRHRPNVDSRYVLWRKKMVLVRMQGRDFGEPEPEEDTDEP